MKRFSVIMTIAISLLIFTPLCYSQNIKIGVVDIQEFQRRSKAFQKIRLKLRKKYEALQAKLDKEKQALLKMEEEFRKQRLMLSLDAQEDKKRQLEKKRRYYKYLYEELTEEMKNAEMEETKRVSKELEKVVDKIAKKEGYTLILEKRTVGLVYYDDSIDITQKVIEAYDKMKGGSQQ